MTSSHPTLEGMAHAMCEATRNEDVSDRIWDTG